MNKILKSPEENKAVYRDTFGRDGFCEFHLHLFLAILELPEKIQEEPMDSPKLDSSRKVKELFKAFDRRLNFSLN